MLDKCNYGLIGAGMMGQEHIRNIALIQHADVVAMFEPDPGMRKKVKEMVPDIFVAENLESLVRNPDVTALLVASPNHMHAGQFREIAGIKPLPILMEKPLFTDPADENMIADLTLKYPMPVWVAMEYRYMPPVAKFVEQVDAVTGGIKMLTIREHRFPFLQKVGNWNRFNCNSGGTLVEKCCHFFDLMRFIIKDNPVRIMASGGQAVNHLDEVYDGDASDIWDNAFVIVDFANGARAMLDLCMFAEGSRFQEEISATGPNGKIEVFVPGPRRFWPEGEPEPVPKIIVSPRHTKCREIQDILVDPQLLTAGDHNGATYYQHQRFLDVVRGMGSPEVSLEDGIWAVKMGMAAQESARTGQAVSL